MSKSFHHKLTEQDRRDKQKKVYYKQRRAKRMVKVVTKEAALEVPAVGEIDNLLPRDAERTEYEY